MRRTREDVIIHVIGYITVTIISIFCLIPFLLLISGSISQESDILKYGYSLIPKHISFDAYRLIFKMPEQIIRAYGVTIFITLVGGCISLFITSMTAFVIMRKDFKYRNQFAFFFYFSSLFSGGMIPSYILVSQYLHLKDNILSLMLPPLLGAWNIFLMRNYMKEIPDSLAESAKIDGANDLYIFIKIYLPLSAPGLATVGLFIGLMYWNDWFHAMMYINKPELFPLQYLLYQMLTSIKGLQDAANQANLVVGDLPSETFKMAMAVVVTGPIIFLYPFVQKYFVKGLTIGAVKG